MNDNTATLTAPALPDTDLDHDLAAHLDGLRALRARATTATAGEIAGLIAEAAAAQAWAVKFDRRSQVAALMALEASRIELLFFRRAGQAYPDALTGIKRSTAEWLGGLGDDVFGKLAEAMTAPRAPVMLYRDHVRAERRRLDQQARDEARAREQARAEAQAAPQVDAGPGAVEPGHVEQAAEQAERPDTAPGHPTLVVWADDDDRWQITMWADATVEQVRAAARSWTDFADRLEAAAAQVPGETSADALWTASQR